MKIGKAPDNDLVLPDDTVSRYHLTIARVREGLEVKDLGSTNGVRIGGAKIKEAIVDHVKRLGYESQVFLDSSDGTGLAAGAGWNLEEVERVARRCVGAVIIGLPFWKTTQDGRECWLPTDYCQYEGAIAHAYGLPILAIAVGIEQRVIFDQYARLHKVSIPLQEDLSWLQTEAFRGPFEKWKREIEQRCDVFLGYCSKSAGTAAQIQLFLERLGASVLNYAMDFKAGLSILAEIESARASCSCGVFLFSEDDPLESASGGAAPRERPRAMPYRQTRRGEDASRRRRSDLCPSKQDR